MRHLKTFLFFACCLAVGIGIAVVVIKIRTPRPEDNTVHRESGAPPALCGFCLPLDPSATETLDRLSAVHGNAVAVSYPAGRSIAAPALAAFVERAHGRGCKVLLLPPPQFSPKNPYPAPLAKIAAEAQTAQVDILCLSWLDSDPDETYWEGEAAAVRHVFNGQLILAGTPGALALVEFADCADFLGAIGPVEPSRRLPHAPDNVDVHALRIAWDCALDSLESLALKSSRPLILLNMAVPETIRLKLDLPGSPPPPPTPDPEMQLLAYRALLIETRARQSTEGLFLPAPEKAVSTAFVPRFVAELQSQWSPPAPAP